MTLLYTDPLFLRHETGPHPERPDRLRAVTARLAKSGVAGLCAHGDYQPMTEEEVKALHDPRQVLFAKRVCEQGGGRLDGDTAGSAESFTVALAAAGACASAVDAVIEGKARNALCLVRPPGHHATPTTSMGFCLFNNIALAAQALAGTRPVAHPDRRLGRASRERHAGHFLRRWRSRILQHPSLPVLPRHRRRRRDGDRPRPRPHAEHADPLRYVAAEFRSAFTSALEKAADAIKPELVLLAPASTPTPPTRSARWGWRSRISRT